MADSESTTNPNMQDPQPDNVTTLFERFALADAITEDGTPVEADNLSEETVAFRERLLKEVIASGLSPHHVEYVVTKQLEAFDRNVEFITTCRHYGVSVETATHALLMAARRFDGSNVLSNLAPQLDAKKTRKKKDEARTTNTDAKTRKKRKQERGTDTEYPNQLDDFNNNDNFTVSDESDTEYDDDKSADPPIGPLGTARIHQPKRYTIITKQLMAFDDEHTQTEMMQFKQQMFDNLVKGEYVYTFTDSAIKVPVKEASTITNLLFGLLDHSGARHLQTLVAEVNEHGVFVVQEGSARNKARTMVQTASPSKALAAVVRYFESFADCGNLASTGDNAAVSEYLAVAKALEHHDAIKHMEKLLGNRSKRMTELMRTLGVDTELKGESLLYDFVAKSAEPQMTLTIARKHVKLADCYFRLVTAFPAAIVLLPQAARMEIRKMNTAYLCAGIVQFGLVLPQSIRDATKAAAKHLRIDINERINERDGASLKIEKIIISHHHGKNKYLAFDQILDQILQAYPGSAEDLDSEDEED